MMSCRSLLVAVLLLVAGTLSAHAQKPACKQSGTVTPGHIAIWTTDCVLQDGGTPANPQITGGVGVASGNQQSICTRNAKNGAVSQLCLGSPATGGVLTYDTLGGPALPFQFVINGATYTFPFPSAPINVPFLAATSFGVVADGVLNSSGGFISGTSNDLAMASAVNACAATGTSLYLPPGLILLTGSATINLRNCAIHGVGVPGGLAGTPGSYGSMFLLTSTSVKPFNIGSNWSMSDVNFFWPNQTTGTQFYPPLFSAASETTSTSDWYLDHVNIIDAYDGIVTGGGRFNITDVNIYMMRDGLRVGNIGDSFSLTRVFFTPGPWFTMTNFTAPYLAATANNVAVHAQAGGNNVVNFAAVSVGAFSLHEAIKIDNGVTVGISEFSAVLDGVDSVIDAASGGVWAGFANAPLRGTAGCTDICFKMGANSTLFLDGWVGSSQHSFVETASSNIYMSNVFATAGLANNGTDYYMVHATANTGGLIINVNNSILQGVPADTKVHGIKTDVAASSVTIENVSFTYFNDDIDIQSTAVPTVIIGNRSAGTTGSASIVAASLASGAHGVSFSNNAFDKPPQASITAGFGAGPTISGGFSGAIFPGTGSVTTGSFQLPFVPIGSFGGGCTFTPSIGTFISASVTGSPPIWSILSSVNLASGQLFYNCGGGSQQ